MTIFPKSEKCISGQIFLKQNFFTELTILEEFNGTRKMGLELIITNYDSKKAT